MERPRDNGDNEAGEVRTRGIIENQNPDRMACCRQPVDGSVGDLAGLTLSCGKGNQQLDRVGFVRGARRLQDSALGSP
jgi:hypothetical protein